MDLITPPIIMKLYYLSTTSFADCDMNLLHHLSAKYDITYGVIIPNKNANYTEKELVNYCDNHKINFVPFYTKYRFRDLRNIKTYLYLIKSIISANYGLIYINNFDQFYLNCLLSLTLPKTKTIVGLHDVISHSGTSGSYLVQLSKRILIKSFNAFLTFSESQATIFRNRWSKKSVYTIPLILKNFGPLATSIDHQTTNFLFFGNIKPYKGLDILLNSINRISCKYNSFTLTIAGRSSDWEKMYEPLLNSNALIKTYIRYIKNDEIPYFFSKTHYLILPYKDTTQSGPLMIAYNYNIPVIASDIDGFREFISDSSTGYLFDINNEFDLDRVLEKAINRSSDDYTIMVSNLQEYINHTLSVTTIVNKYENLFTKLFLQGA